MAPEEVLMMGGQGIGMKRVILTMKWGINGFHVTDMTRPGEFQSRVLPESYHGSFAGESLSGWGKRSYTSPECPPGQSAGSFSECVKTVFDEQSLVTVPHPSCSSDLAPADLFLFGHIKTFLAGRVFNDINCLLRQLSSFE
jgi:hypothetical protein